jgi:signal transduction histidine kinase/ligand-binding sensor domain-containing protein
VFFRRREAHLRGTPQISTTTAEPEVQLHRTSTLPGQEDYYQVAASEDRFPDWTVAYAVKGWSVMLLISLIKIIVTHFLDHYATVCHTLCHERLGARTMDMMRYVRGVVISGIVLLSAANSASALDPNLRITQYRHTAWRLQEGAFASAPNAIAQTADGYIWIGTSSGLVRYDGVHFSPWSPPEARSLSGAIVYSLRASSDGSLWIGTSEGLTSWKNGQIQEHVRGRINSILEDRTGRIWVTRSRVPDSDGGLCQVRGEHPGCIGGDDRMQLPNAVPLSEDPQGNLWIGNSNQLMRWHDGSFKTYFRKELDSSRGLEGINDIAVAGDGSVWVARAMKDFGLFRIVHDVAEKAVLPGNAQGRAVTLFIDREGSLWMGTSDAGVYRLAAGRLDHFGSENGLSGSAVNNFFEDREGDLWVATSKGLDRFADNRVVTFSANEGLSGDLVQSVLATEDGGVWVGNKGGLDVLRGNDVKSIQIPGKRVTALWQDHAKRLWVGVDNELTIYDRGQFRKISRPDGSPLGGVVAMTEDRDQNLWVSVTGRDRKLFRIHDLRVEDDFPAAPFTRLLASDPTGGIWLAPNRNLGHYRNGKLELIPVQEKKSAIQGLTVDADGSVWASTLSGLTHWENGRMDTLTAKNGLPCDGVFSSIRDNNATLWLYSQCGFVGIPDSELRRWWQQPNRTIKFQVLDVFDGALPAPSTFQPAVAKSPDGRLWFANDAVLQTIDAGGLRKNGMAPPVYIEQVSADRKDYAIGGLVRFPAGSRDIEISYTALSFSIPEKIRFRYKLEGRDQKWQDAGTRREVFYSDLAPDRYRFRVMASNSDGVWNEAGAAFDFSIAPAYYQTAWFRASLAAVFAAVLWGLYRLRLYQVAREFSAQTGERARIARDLHDTLLQSFHASLIQMQTARNIFSRRPEEAVKTLDHAIGSAEQAIDEGRRTIQDLRTTVAPLSNLEYLLTAAAQELAEAPDSNGAQPEFRVTVEGARRILAPAIQDEVYQISREVLRNAFRHAHASRIEAEIRYDKRNLRLRIRDDGRGIERHVLEEGARAGHWGLTGIRERAKRIGGQFDIWSEAGAGTEIELTVPASRAYARPQAPRRFGFFRKKTDIV